MITLPFYNPQTVTQVNVPNPVTGVPSVAWQTAAMQTSTIGGLYTISGLWQERYLTQTHRLWCTNFKLPAVEMTVVGIELELDVRRAARIEDMTIQLALNGELIGDNYASLINPVQANMYTAESVEMPVPYDDYHIYGGNADMWGTELTAVDVVDPTFGIVISFHSNIYVPHRDIVYLDQVGLRITYA